MRITIPARRSWLLPLAALGLGCASTGGVTRNGNDPKIQTIASVGDRPVATRAGRTLTSSAVADLAALNSPRTRDDRVSGRVVDESGDPVPNAHVRVAAGGISGGRVAEATSDRAGGFTLRGLRPGSNYTLIAEYEGQGGLVEGRAEAPHPIDRRRDRRPVRRPPGRPPPRRALPEGPDGLRSGRTRRGPRLVLARQSRRPARLRRRRPGRGPGEAPAHFGHGRGLGLGLAREPLGKEG